MNTYVQTPEGPAAIRASRAQVAKLPQVIGGLWSVIPATGALRRGARLNVTIPTLRILPDGRVGAL